MTPEEKPPEYYIKMFPLFTMLMAAKMISSGWALKTLWSWFVVPVFASPQLPFASAVGLCLIGMLLTQDYLPSYEKGQTIWRKIGDTLGFVVKPLLPLLLGWIVHLLS
jgi:hypothetical protein